MQTMMQLPTGTSCVESAVSSSKIVSLSLERERVFCFTPVFLTVRTVLHTTSLSIAVPGAQRGSRRVRNSSTGSTGSSYTRYYIVVLPVLYGSPRIVRESLEVHNVDVPRAIVSEVNNDRAL